MKKKVFYFFVLLLMANVGLVSCDGEYDYNDMTRNDDLYKDGVRAADNLANFIIVEFKLINAEGKSTTIFPYGENITFDMTLRNISNQTITLSETELLGKDLFRVYTKDGKDLGRPWDITLVRAIYPAPPCTIDSGEAYSWNCKWKGFLDTPEGIINSETPDIPLSETDKIQFIQTEMRTNLPKGDYYCQFDVSLGGDVKTCRQDFTIE